MPNEIPKVRNTRFNPTINGPLHLGHLYLALVNEYEAHSSGGQFIIRFDDNQNEWLEMLGQEKIERYREQIVTDLSQYVKADRWTRQSDNLLKLGQVHIPPRPEKMSAAPDWMPRESRFEPAYYMDCPEWIGDRYMIMFPYAPELTAERVLLDYLEKINWLIRGEDLVSEFALYEYYREQAGLPFIRHTYLPRLRAKQGNQLSAVSKTRGGNTISDMTARFGCRGVLDLLREACLVDPDGPFAVANIKSDPRLSL